MKKLSFLLTGLVAMFVFSVSNAFAVKAVTIVEPVNGSEAHSPVKVCMKVFGVTVEPAKKGVHDGTGHHHLLIDVDLPTDLSAPIGKDAHHVHMGDGSTCKSLELSPGHHTIRALFAQGNHVPYSPPVSDTIMINVK